MIARAVAIDVVVMLGSMSPVWASIAKGLGCSLPGATVRDAMRTLNSGYSTGLIQPFVNYNFPEGFYLTSAPIATVDWKADSGQQWTVPLGGGVGKIFHLGKLPVNTQLSGYYNVVHPDNAANWQLRLQVQLMFPK